MYGSFKFNGKGKLFKLNTFYSNFFMFVILFFHTKKPFFSSKNGPDTLGVLQRGYHSIICTSESNLSLNTNKEVDWRNHKCFTFHLFKSALTPNLKNLMRL